MSESSYDARFLAGVEYFNVCDFFEAHEAWEELWADTQGPSRPFFQGLIQVAVCLHHYGNGNAAGARKLYHGSRKYLEPFLPGYSGVDLVQLLAQLERCCAPILEDDSQRTVPEIDPETIPEIHLDPPPAG